MALDVARRLFTVDEYDHLIETGFFGPEERLELVDGEIITMSPIGAPHAACVARLMDLFMTRLGERALVWVQNPVILGVRQEFVPDIVLLRRRDDYYASRRPRPADSLLVIEVADTTFHLDRSVKVPRYAAAGIVEVWLADLQRDIILIYDTPRSDGYASPRTARRGEHLTPVCFPDVSLAVDDLLGPPGLPPGDDQ
jgi:Uma2 family endonuclease